MYEQKDIKKERMRVKKDKLKIFFKREIAVQKTEFKKKEIKKIKGQTEKEMKKEVNAKRDEQKQEVMKKGRKKLVRKKKSKEIHFKNTEEFFQRERYKAIKTNKTGVCSQKCFS